ncbi:S26 family signal peptidase [Sphingomonas koreensis]|jgi:conjugative transfer signal peptidase TraF|uniref:S26 family signal peptidase n=1 Tax=Sphingomonas koreensis TaxID=93064 RepID=A0A1L6JFB1_9SPHN|nr:MULTISPECIES: S26 family signal peptidase [Sphingomonas]APR54595.1 S26 family signal peptidase [Sphingomonas koreensis]MDK2769246.1 S26 family signal peptidase [Sphingomonas sp.]PJI89743.1 conjugative transfer signal peptidase TraF [Sphingomonas koreensis]RSU20437.1 S26 family signal peptidase [Sphingomonas koreensis]RSU28867.1 S26 family signal peptidase [Sphingomonas koreensis]
MIERRDLPLFAWGEALRAAKWRRRILVRRTTLVALGCACLAATIVAPPLPRLLWNASASAPVGLYRVAPGHGVVRGDMVIARTPLPVRALAASRHYVPANVPLVKRVAGVPGDLVCAIGPEILVNGSVLATRRASDRLGRPLPWWTGCRILRNGALLLLMSDTPDSFDGRYFGPTDAADVIGKATILWTWSGGSNGG